MPKSIPISTPTPKTYDKDEHSHRFAAWAAGRAASVKSCRFSVEKARAMLEKAKFTSSLANPSALPEPAEVDRCHRAWRKDLIGAGSCLDLELTHGVAAKLINVYLKARFVCGGYAEDSKVAALHPPIDRLLLHGLASSDFCGQARTWRQAESRGWSNFDPDEYENLICELRKGLKGAPFWMIETHWQGHQRPK